MVDPIDAVLHRVPTVAVAGGHSSNYRSIATDRDVARSLWCFYDKKYHVLGTLHESKRKAVPSVKGSLNVSLRR